MAVEQGKEYNPETATDLRPKRFEFHSCGFTFAYTVEIPAYVLVRLDSSELDRLYEYMHRYAAHVATEAIRGGYAHTDSGLATMRSDVGKHLKNYIWDRFSIAQERAGNDCWQTAPTLQEVHTK
jgi:hypothetical protein